MADSIIMERVADAAAECFYAELVKTEDLGAFEALVAADMRKIAACVLRRCIERFDVERTTNSHPAAFTDVRGTADRATVPQDGIRSLRSVRDASEIARRRVSLDGGARRGLPRQYALDSPEETAHPRGALDGLLLRLLGIVGDASVAAKRAYRSNRGTRERPFVLPNRRGHALPDAGG